MMPIPERELWLHWNAEAKAMVEKGLAEMACGEAVAIDLPTLPEDD